MIQFIQHKIHIGMVALAAMPAVLSAATDERPNIVFILADDLGIECLTTYGGKSHETPNIDRLRKQGMQFSHCFSNPLERISDSRCGGGHGLK